jgi:hypothetical protein
MTDTTLARSKKPSQQITSTFSSTIKSMLISCQFIEVVVKLLVLSFRYLQLIHTTKCRQWVVHMFSCRKQLQNIESSMNGYVLIHEPQMLSIKIILINVIMPRNNSCNSCTRWVKETLA